jgi:hypothetical protein
MRVDRQQQSPTVHHPPNPDNYTRNVTDADAWAERHLEALRLVYQAFEEGGEWPQIESLQRGLIRQGSDRDLVAEFAEMPPTIGIAQHSGEVSLSIRGLSHLPESSPLLASFIAVIELAVERFRGTDEEPKVTDGDLPGLGMDARTAQRVSALIFRESWPFGSGSGLPDGTWERSVTLEIRHLVTVRTVAEYLRIQAELRYGPPPTRGPSTPEALELSRMPPAPPIVPLEDLGLAGKAKASSAPASNPPRTARSISDGVLLRLVFKVLVKLKDEGYFIEAFEEGEWHGLRRGGEPVIAPPRIEDPEAWLMLAFGIEGLWPYLAEPRRLAEHATLASPFSDQGLLLEILELLHRDVVSRPVTDEEGIFEGSYDRGGGQRRLREELAPILARLDPPLEMRSDGEIAPRSAIGLEALSDQPLPSSAGADDVRDKVQDAIRLFRDRGASVEGQLAALTQLASVLERLRDDGRLVDAMARKDSGTLFDIANNYGIRHDNAGQRRDYGPAFREWIFHAYLAAIRFSTRVADEEGSEAP